MVTGKFRWIVEGVTPYQFVYFTKKFIEEGHQGEMLPRQFGWSNDQAWQYQQLIIQILHVHWQVAWSALTSCSFVMVASSCVNSFNSRNLSISSTLSFRASSRCLHSARLHQNRIPDMTSVKTAQSGLRPYLHFWSYLDKTKSSQF